MVDYELEKIGSFSPDSICKSPDEKIICFLSGLTLFTFRQGEKQSIQMTEKFADLALSNDLIFCLSNSGKIHVLDNKDLEAVYNIDISAENANFSNIFIFNNQLILRSEDFAEIRTFQGDKKLQINCSKNANVFLFDQEIVVLVEEIEFIVSITLRHKKQVHQTSLVGRIRQVFADQSSSSIIVLFDHGGLYQIDCRHLSPLQKFEIPFKSTQPVENMQFSESTNLIIFQHEESVTILSLDTYANFSIPQKFSQLLLFSGNLLLTNHHLYEVIQIESLISVSFTHSLQRGSPLAKLHKLEKTSTPVDPKKVLFHKKVSSSNYGLVQPRRKMFQPQLHKKPIPAGKLRKKSSSSASLKIVEANFQRPTGHEIAAGHLRAFKTPPNKD
ncbi:unnamed protein product [Oikopleura dioica]|uniref:Uncharacterized protein n=1 Tax=Oikopleura dioica TaxID=34765 RepID=E4Y7V4_OIKDI|nr:unnamed protein product [Oikopleura dioica]